MGLVELPSILYQRDTFKSLDLSSLTILTPSNPCTIRTKRFPVRLEIDPQVVNPDKLGLALFPPGDLGFEQFRMLIEGRSPDEHFRLLSLEGVQTQNGILDAEVDLSSILDCPDLNLKEFEAVFYCLSDSSDSVDLSEELPSLSLSNSIRLAIEPVESWGQPVGGFLSPTKGFHGSDHLAILGWGLRPDSALERIELSLNGKNVPGVGCELSSPQLAASLPGLVEAENCMFSVLLDRSEFITSPDAQVVELCAKLYFSETGADELKTRGGEAPLTLDLVTPKFCWGVSSSSPLSDIEFVSVNHSGGIDIRGWIYTPDFERPRIFALVYGEKVELERTNSFGSLNLFSSPTSVYKNLAHSCRDDFGFTYTFSPGALGDRPGIVPLYFEHGEKVFSLGGIPDWLKIGKLVFQQASNRSIASKSVHFARGIGGSLKRIVKPLAGVRRVNSPGNLSESFDIPSPVFCSQSLSPYEGSPRVLLEMLKVHRKKYPRQKPLLISPSDGELKEDFEKLGVDVCIFDRLFLSVDSWNDYLEGLSDAYDLLKLRATNYFVVNTIDCFWGIHLAGALSRPVSWVIHESTDPSRAHTQLDFRQRSQFFDAFSKVSNFVFVSKGSQAVYERLVDKNKTSVISNGIDLENFPISDRQLLAEGCRKKLGFADSDFVVSMVGSICERKGQHVLLEAFAALVEESLANGRIEIEKLKLVFVGDREQSYFTKVCNLVEEFGLSNRVVFAEKSRDVGQFYALSNILVIASREESAPLVSLEAMAWSLPIISTPVFGLAEQLEDEESALFFSVDDARCLSSQLRRLILEPELCKRLGEGARRRVESHFSLERSKVLYGKEFESLESKV